MNIIVADDLKDKIEHGIKVTIVNVLDPEYYEDCHIKGSINVPLNQLQQIAHEWDKSRDIIVYCTDSNCSASSSAYKILEEMGFGKIYLYKNGMKEWKEKGYNCEGVCQKEYLKT